MLLRSSWLRARSRNIRAEYLWTEENKPCELGEGRIEPMRTDACHVERRYDPLWLTQVIPFDANDFQHAKSLGTEPKHLIRKVYFYQSLVKFINDIAFLQRIEKRADIGERMQEARTRDEVRERHLDGRG
jgi:hypothetical protein